MDEILDYLAARKHIYSLLGGFFYKEADSAYLEALGRVMPVIRAMGLEYNIPEAVKGADTVISVKGGDTFEDKAAKEFAAVFLINDVFKGIKPVTPHESVYLSLSGMVMQEERDGVMEEYFKEGLGKDKGFKEPEDHIKAEFDFMAYMTEKAVELAEKNDMEGLKENIEKQSSFISCHIGKWVGRLCADVAARAKSDFFKGMAMAVESFIKADGIFLNGFDEIFKYAEA